MPKSNTRYMIEYNYTSLTVNLIKLKPEPRRFVTDKFEDALAEYRRITELTNLLGDSPVADLNAYTVQLDTPLDLEQYL